MNVSAVLTPSYTVLQRSCCPLPFLSISIPLFSHVQIFISCAPAVLTPFRQPKIKQSHARVVLPLQICSDHPRLAPRLLEPILYLRAERHFLESTYHIQHYQLRPPPLC